MEFHAWAPLFYFPRRYLNLTTCVNNLHYEKFQDGTVKCIEDEIPFEVPEGWAWCKLNDIYNFIDYRGATPTKITNGIPLVTAKNVKSGYIDYTIDDYISEEEFKERQQRGISKKGDILFTTEAPLGNAALADMEKFSAGQRLITFQQYGSKNELINYVMLMFILSDFFQQQLYVNKTGSTVAGIKAAILKTLWIPVPPYNEQLRISNTLKSAINLIDSISKNKEILSTSISNTKSKILDLAIRGKIVPQDPNDEPASVLLERIRAEKEELIKQGKIKRDKKESVIFKGDDNSYYESIGDETTNIDDEIPFELPQNWEWSRLQTICYPITDGTHKTPTYSDTGYIFLSAKNITTGKINWNDVMYIPKSLHDELYSRISPQINDILLAKNGTTGVAAIVDRECEFDIYVTLALLRVISNNDILPQYLLKILASNTIQDYFNSSLKGIGVPNLHLEHIRTTLIPIPPINEQKRISKKVDQLFFLLDSIAKNAN